MPDQVKVNLLRIYYIVFLTLSFLQFHLHTRVLKPFLAVINKSSHHSHRGKEGGILSLFAGIFRLKGRVLGPGWRESTGLYLSLSLTYPEPRGKTPAWFTVLHL